MMLEFIDDDSGYRAWIRANPTGYVINTYREGSNTYNVFHAANCRTISDPKTRNYTTTGYKKLCSLNKRELMAYGNKMGNLQICKICGGSWEIEYPIDE